jgi:hypothetical protein
VTGCADRSQQRQSASSPSVQSVSKSDCITTAAAAAGYAVFCQSAALVPLFSQSRLFHVRVTSCHQHRRNSDNSSNNKYNKSSNRKSFFPASSSPESNADRSHKVHSQSPEEREKRNQQTSSSGIERQKRMTESSRASFFTTLRFQKKLCRIVANTNCILIEPISSPNCESIFPPGIPGKNLIPCRLVTDFTLFFLSTLFLFCFFQCEL